MFHSLIERISCDGGHCAFTSMQSFDKSLFLAYREASAHVSHDGVISIMSSLDGQSWYPVCKVSVEGQDLRDPKLSVNHNGKLCLLAAGVIRKKAHNNILYNYMWVSENGVNWDGPYPIAEQDMWLWRSTWIWGRCYGFAYCVGSKRESPRYVSLYGSENGIDFHVIVDHAFAEGYPNEHAMLFDDDGKAWCLLRRDDDSQTAMLGSSIPPYTDWNWRPLGVLLGGPQMLKGPDGQVWVGARLYDGVIRTSLCTLDLDSAKLDEVLTLPSGGDCSYPDMVWLENGDMLMSYYSSHEGSSSVYVAHIQPD